MIRKVYRRGYPYILTKGEELKIDSGTVTKTNLICTKHSLRVVWMGKRRYNSSELLSWYIDHVGKEESDCR